MDSLKDFLSIPAWYYPELKEITGSVNAALILQRLIYWWSRKQGKYIYKTVDELKTELALSRDMQLSAIKELERRKLVKVYYYGMPAKRHFDVYTEEIRNQLIKLHAKRKDSDSQKIEDITTYVEETDNCMTDNPTSFGGDPDNKISIKSTKDVGKSYNNVKEMTTHYTSNTSKDTARDTSKNIQSCENEFSKSNIDSLNIKGIIDSENDSKENPPGSGAPPFSKEEVMTLHSRMRDLFEKVFIEKGGQPYYWEGKDGKHLNELIKKIEFLMKSEKMKISDDKILEQFYFIMESIQDAWILDHLSVSILNSKFNEIILKIKKENNGRTQGSNECCTSEAYKREVYERLFNK